MQERTHYILGAITQDASNASEVFAKISQASVSMIPVTGVPNTKEPEAITEWETSTHEDEDANNEKIGWGTKYPWLGLG